MIGRIRKLLVGTGILLVVVLAAFLGISKWKATFIHRDLPRQLGINIQQESNGVTYTQAHAGHILFKIHASRVVQLRDSRALLHDVSIEFYGPDGKRTDRIEGDAFEYDQKTGVAVTSGLVSMTLAGPLSPHAAPGSLSTARPHNKQRASAGQNATGGKIHVQTSGLTFNEKTGVVTTTQLVNFSLSQGSGSAVGALYNPKQGYLVLDRTVQLTTRRNGQTVVIHARHAEFERDARLCTLLAASADSSDGQATAATAKIFFREDGSAMRLDGSGGFTLTTAHGAHMAALSGTMDFTEHNQPRGGYLQGGVTMDAVSPGRTLHGTSPTARLAFTSQGELRSAQLERGVELRTEEQEQPVAGAPASARQLVRHTWRSPVADIEFRDGTGGRIEPSSIRGSGGVTVTTQTRTGDEPPSSTSLAADQVTGAFGANSTLTALTGVGHARMETTTATGTWQTATADRLVAHFAAVEAARSGKSPASRPAGPEQMQSAQLDGHVVLLDQPTARPGAQPQTPMRATAGRADYDGAAARLHLTLAPRVQDGDIQLSATTIDIAQDSGDAFAHGNVKATWISTDGGAASGTQGGALLDGQGPAHVIASQAQLDRARDEATFRGHVHLWRQNNSVSGPLVVLDDRNQTLTATSTDPADPVRLVLVSTAGPTRQEAGRRTGQGSKAKETAKPAAPSVVRVRGGSLWYSGVQHKVVMRGGALGQVFAEMTAATSISNEVELLLVPSSNRATASNAQTQVDRLTATGHVALTLQDRHATGQRLIYTNRTGDYVLTGTPAAPPRMTDPQYGSVTGKALIFHSRDDSVSIEGGGRKTTTETTAPR